MTTHLLAKEPVNGINPEFDFVPGVTQCGLKVIRVKSLVGLVWERTPTGADVEIVVADPTCKNCWRNFTRRQADAKR